MNEDRFGAIGPLLRASVAAIGLLLGAGMASEAGAQGAHYVYADRAGFASAFCASGEPVVGGGFMAVDPTRLDDQSLRATYPIVNASGELAWSTTAIGWRSAEADFTGLVRAYAVCADARLAAAISVQYVSQEATGMSRAYCPAGTKVIGGGGYVNGEGKHISTPVRLRQTHPISDDTGVIAFGSNAIGWQAASSDFTGRVVAVAICATGGKIAIEYRSAQDTYPGMARAFCPAGTIVTAGGGFVETSPFAPVALRETFPIADHTGVRAYDRNAIGWQTVASDFANTVVAFAVCVSGA